MPFEKPKPPAEPTAQSIGRRVKKARKAKGMDPFAFALQAEITVEALEMLERGDYQPGALVLWRIARALEVTTDALLKP